MAAEIRRGEVIFAGNMVLARASDMLHAVSAQRKGTPETVPVVTICVVLDAVALQWHLGMMGAEHRGNALYEMCAPPPLVDAYSGGVIVNERTIEKKLSGLVCMATSIGDSADGGPCGIARPVPVHVRYLEGGTASAVAEASPGTLARVIVDTVKLVCEQAAGGARVVLLGDEQDASDALLLAIAVYAAGVHAAALAHADDVNGGWRPRVASEPRHLEAVTRVASAFIEGRFAQKAGASWFFERHSERVVPVPRRALRRALGVAMCSDAWTALVSGENKALARADEWLWSAHSGATARDAAAAFMLASRPGVPGSAQVPQKHPLHDTPDDDPALVYDPAFPRPLSGLLAQQAVHTLETHYAQQADELWERKRRRPTRFSDVALHAYGGGAGGAQIQRA